MKKQVDPKFWKPIVTERPQRQKVYKKSETRSFLDYQPISERYEVPGLMPRAPRRSKEEIK